jgi:thiol-disulfide isomerase/thioredoxin
MISHSDFWTTKCTRCPDALDHLQKLAQDYQGIIKFVSICCDSLDGAREILERDDNVRWPAIHHYFMTSHHKEQAKRILGFQTVPFYVLIRGDGTILRMGGPSSDFPTEETISRLFELHEKSIGDKQSRESCWDINNESILKGDLDQHILEEAKTERWGEDGEFVIDDLDF